MLPRMSAFTYRFIASLLALLLIGLGVWLLQQFVWSAASLSSAVSPGDLERSVAAAGQIQPDQSALRNPAVLSQALTQLPLPATDLPLVATIDELETRANAGDSFAACRLAVDLAVCNQLGVHTIDSEELTVERLARSTEDASTQEAILQAHLKAEEQRHSNGWFCSGIDAQRIGAVQRYQLQAARAGHTRAALDFLLGKGGTPEAAELIARPELAHLYHEHTVPLLRSLLAQGEPAGLIAWHLANSGAFVPLASALPPDMRNANLSYALQRRLLNEVSWLHAADLFNDTPPLSPDEQHAADRYFAPYERSAKLQVLFERAKQLQSSSGENIDRRQRALQECEQARWQP